jgi:hypothetical protein
MPVYRLHYLYVALEAGVVLPEFDIVVGEIRHNELEGKPALCSRKKLLHLHQLLQHQEAKFPMAGSQFNDVKRFVEIYAELLLAPFGEHVIHKAENHVRVHLCNAAVGGHEIGHNSIAPGPNPLLIIKGPHPIPDH